jgi:hypothetical protein
MKLRTKVVAAMWQRFAAAWASAPAASAHPDMMLLKFVMNKDR